MPASALPEHLRDHNSAHIGDKTDWDNWLQAYVPRGWFAFGPNAKPGWDWITLIYFPYKFARFDKFPWFRPTGWFRIPIPIPVPARWRRFPVLLLGWNVTRWMGERDREVLFVNSLYEKWCGKLAFWGRNKQFQVTHMQTINQDPDFKRSLENYGPSPIQYYSKAGFALTWPLHFAFWFQWDRKEKGTADPKGEQFNKIIFFRIGMRWDSLDDYYAGPSLFIGGTFN